MARIVVLIVLACMVMGSTVYGVQITLQPMSRPIYVHNPGFSISVSQPSSVAVGEYATAKISISTVDDYSGQASLLAVEPLGINCQGTTGSLSILLDIPGTWAISCSSIFEGSFTVNVTSTAGNVSKSTSITFNYVRRSDNMLVNFSCAGSTIIINETTLCNVTVTDSHNPTLQLAGIVSFDVNPELHINPKVCVLIQNQCIIHLIPSGSGIFTVSASYTGDRRHAFLQSNYLIHAILPPTTTQISCATNITMVHQNLNCRVTTMDLSNVTNYLSGQISFHTSQKTSNNVPLPNCILDKGICSVTFQLNQTGTFQLTGQYAGDHTHSGSIGNFTVTVHGSPTQLLSTCDPTNIVWNATYGLCSVTVLDLSNNPSTPTGSVNVTCSSKCYGIPSAGCSLVVNSNKSSLCSFHITSGTSVDSMNVTMNYLGDSNHDPSSGQNVMFTVSQGPSIVTVSGTITVTCAGCTMSAMNLIDTKSNIVYVATIVDGTYTVQLPNRLSYNVILSWKTTKGNLATCNAGILTLRSTKTIQYEDLVVNINDNCKN